MESKERDSLSEDRTEGITEETGASSNEEIIATSETINDRNTGLKILFLMSDTGGGHRASAESLAAEFLAQYPGSTYELVDLLSEYGPGLYKKLVPGYQYLSERPVQWKMAYHLSNLKVTHSLMELWLQSASEKKFRERITSIDPDLIVSVHPMMNHAVCFATKKNSQDSGILIPFFTVITDLGTCHSTWFNMEVEQIYVASERIRDIGTLACKVPSEKIQVVGGLPIRREFAYYSEKLKDRTSDHGKQYQHEIRRELNLNVPDKSEKGNNFVILAMGGGNGVGYLSEIVDSLFIEFYKCMKKQREDHAQGSRNNQTSMIDTVTIVVICGRNEKLREEFCTRNWNLLVEEIERKSLLSRLICLKSRVSPLGNNADDCNNSTSSEDLSSSSLVDRIKIIPYGYVSEMAKFMVAADVLVSKAGPGTIAEASTLGLPIMLTSFLPGQEEGNVEFVVKENKFGTYIPDSYPMNIAREILSWVLNKEKKLKPMSLNARKCANPYAASDIVRSIGENAERWKDAQ